MVITCAVPKCKSGYKSQKEKLSMFKVPRNIEMRKKWEAAIPGVVAFKETYFICEKHFEGHYIIRNYIKHDANGKIIANVPFQRPRLHSSAVPTIFDDNTSCIYNKVELVPELVHTTESHQSIIGTSDEVTTRPCIDFGDEIVHVELSSCDQQKSSEKASAEVEVSMSVNDRILGYLCKQVLKIYNSCDTCIKAVKIDSCSRASVPNAATKLIDMKTRGGLIYANLKFFNLIRHVEACFAKYAYHVDVFELTFDEVITTYDFTFPCKEHASDILSFALVYYIRLRMRQHAHQQNLKLSKKFVVKKKLSKLTNE